MNMHVCPDCKQMCLCDCVDREYDCTHFQNRDGVVCKSDDSGRSDSELRIIGSRDYDDQEYELGEAGA